MINLEKEVTDRIEAVTIAMPKVQLNCLMGAECGYKTDKVKSWILPCCYCRCTPSWHTRRG